MGKDTRTYKDRAEYLKKAVTERRRKLKKRAVEYKGGKCQICGYNKFVGALEFHHKKEDTKKFGISMKGYSRSWENIEKEIKKCMLVCSNCHRELHYKEGKTKDS